MTARAPGTRRLSPTLALCLALIGASSFLYYHQALFIPRVEAVRVSKGLAGGYSFGNDFYQVWITCRELLRQHRDPYSSETTLEIQQGLYGRLLDRNRPGDPIDPRAFPYPAYTDLLFLPTAAVPFETMRVIVLCTSILLTIAAVLLWLRALAWRLNWQWLVIAALLTLCSYSALEGLFAGQIGLLVAFFLAASVLALQRGRFLLAGILLALTTIKPQVTALAILYLLLWSLHNWRTRRGLCLGFFSTMLALFAASLATIPHWIQSWTHAVLAYRDYTQPPLVAEVLTSPLGSRFSAPAGLILTALSIFLALVLALRTRTAESHSLAFWLTLTTLLAITTITVVQGVAIYDHVILLPGILLLIQHRSALLRTGFVPRLLAVIALLVLLWPWITAFVLIAFGPLLPSATSTATLLFSLPIRTAASLPFAVLALLAWMWRLNLGKNLEAA